MDVSIFWPSSIIALYYSHRFLCLQAVYRAYERLWDSKSCSSFILPLQHHQPTSPNIIQHHHNLTSSSIILIQHHHHHSTSSLFSPPSVIRQSRREQTYPLWNPTPQCTLRHWRAMLMLKSYHTTNILWSLFFATTPVWRLLADQYKDSGHCATGV